MLWQFWRKRDKVYFIEALLETETGEAILWSGILTLDRPIHLESTGDMVKKFVLERANSVEHNRKAVRYVRTKLINYLHEVYKEDNGLDTVG